MPFTTLGGPAGPGKHGIRAARVAKHQTSVEPNLLELKKWGCADENKFVIESVFYCLTTMNLYDCLKFFRGTLLPALCEGRGQYAEGYSYDQITKALQYLQHFPSKAMLLFIPKEDIITSANNIRKDWVTFYKQGIIEIGRF